MTAVQLISSLTPTLRNHAVTKERLEKELSIFEKNVITGLNMEKEGDEQVIAAYQEKAILMQQQAVLLQQKVVAEHKKAVAEQNKTLAEHKKAVAEQNKAIAEHKKALLEQNNALTEQNKALTEQNKAVAEQNKVVGEQKVDNTNKGLQATLEKKQQLYAKNFCSVFIKTLCYIYGQKPPKIEFTASMLNEIYAKYLTDISISVDEKKCYTLHLSCVNNFLEIHKDKKIDTCNFSFFKGRIKGFKEFIAKNITNPSDLKSITLNRCSLSSKAQMKLDAALLANKNFKIIMK